MRTTATIPNNIIAILPTLDIHTLGRAYTICSNRCRDAVSGRARTMWMNRCAAISREAESRGWVIHVAFPGAREWVSSSRTEFADVLKLWDETGARFRSI
jgi:hypothetical protein